MASRVQSPLGIAAATLLLLTKSTAADALEDAPNMSILDPCLGLDVKDVTFNATGSFKTPQFLGESEGPNLKEWTWHTGLDGTNLSSPTQYFWVDTTGSGDLNDDESPYNGTCMSIFELVADLEMWNQPQNDTGDCKSMIGEECLKAIGSGPLRTDPGRCSETVPFEIPEECPMLKDYSSATFEFFPKTKRRDTCNSTENNADGSKSAFYQSNLEDPTIKDFALYDRMAKVGRLILAMPRYTDEKGETKSELQHICMRNTDFAEGSRNSLPKDDGKPAEPSGNSTSNGNPTNTGGSTEPTGAAVKGSVSLASLAIALFVSVFVLFN